MNKLALALVPVLLALPIGLISELSLHVRPPAERTGAGESPVNVFRARGPVDPATRPTGTSAGRATSTSPGAVPLALPYAERVSLGGDERAVVARFELELAPPEVLHVLTAAGEGARGALLLDVLQPRGALGERRLAVFGTDGTTGDGTRVTVASTPGVRWTPPVAGTYVVQVRALPSSVGAFGFALNRRAPLDFPVATDRADAVRSFFGDMRDGGKRDHHGIDIFASRGTDVLAAADGIVARVGRSTRGGLHVWQRAEDATGGRLGSLYYAHLDSVAVLAGTRVARGEVIGTVGNTGNARTTPPHLHFGWYRRFRGPEDPLALVGRARAASLEVEPGHALGPWLAVAAPALNLRAGPGTSFDIVGRLAADSLVEVRGAVGERWVRVRVPVGSDAAPGSIPGSGPESGPESGSGGGTAGPSSESLEGFVARALLAPAPAERLVLDVAGDLLASPWDGAPVLLALDAGTTLVGRGAFGRHRRVVTAGGLDGWIDTATDGAGDRETMLPDG